MARNQLLNNSELLRPVRVLSGNVGRAARLVSAVGALGLVAAGVQVGHTGGTLVYREGAANAYTGPGKAVADGDDHPN